MGSFIGSTFVRADDAMTVAKSCGVGSFFVSPSISGWVGVYEPDGPGDSDGILAQRLSRELGTDAITFLVYDSDFIRYSVFSKGELLDRFQSLNYAVDELEREIPGNPEVLARVFGCLERIEEVREILQTDEVMADDTLFKLADVLGLKNTNMSYDYIIDGNTDVLEGWELFLQCEDGEIGLVE